jgi:UDP-N-acetylglucosamine 2-epimerase
MIHFAIGTKAQLIKTAPVMKRLVERGIAYRYIDTGQHAKTTARLRQTFNFPAPDVCLSPSDSRNVASIKDAGSWTVSLIMEALGDRRKIFQRLFLGLPGVCVIHGDTLSTLFGLMAAKRAGLKVLHLEAGLRSRYLFHPFPEEIARLICMKYANHLAAPNDWAYQNLKAMGYASRSFHTFGNTGAEAVAEVLSRLPAPYSAKAYFALVSIHRFETIMQKKRLQTLVDFIVYMASQISVHFVLHEPTEHRLNHYGLMSLLHKEGVRLTPIMDYPDFLRLLQAAQFVVTDGGSIQEECAYLGTPCLLFRKRTERKDGLGENVCLSGLSPAILRAFAREYPRYRRPPANVEKRPSDVCIDFLISRGYA